MLKGINQWNFTSDTPLEKIFAVSSDAGFDAVELNLYEPGGIGLTMDTTAAEAEAIGKLAQSYGLQLRSLSSSLTGKNPLGSADETVRAQGRRVVTKMLELAEIIGMDTVLVVPGRVDAHSPYDLCYQRSQQELITLAPEAEKHNIHIGIENVWNKFLLSPLEMARYVDEINSSHVGVYFDVGNVLFMGFPEQWIRILGSRIRKVHVKDYKYAAGNGGGHGFVSLLNGDVDWKTVRIALEEIGYTDTLTAELGIYKTEPLQLIYDTARHIDIILGSSAK